MVRRSHLSQQSVVWDFLRTSLNSGKWCMDNTLTAVHKDSLENFHRHFNSVEASIKSTVETETDRQIPFLYALVLCNNDGSIGTTIYRKPTNTGRYLNFHSDSPRAHLEAVVRSLFRWAGIHCFNTALRVKEHSQIVAEPQTNIYDQKFVD